MGSNLFKNGLSVLVLLGSLAALALPPSVTITHVRQRYPWNNKIDVVYALELDPTHTYGLEFRVQNGDSPANTVTTGLDFRDLAAYVGTNTIDLSGLAGFNEVLARTGPTITGVLIDNEGKDPEELDVGDGITFVTGDYLVLDLASGTLVATNGVQNADAFGDSEYKVAKMVFRKVEKGSFMMQAGSSGNPTGTKVTISNDYYIAIYPCTQGQYKALAKALPSTYSQSKSGDSYPCGYPTWKQIAGGTAASSKVSSDLLTVLNGKISASGYTAALPNEAQWERAARAGSDTMYFFGSSDYVDDTRNLARYAVYNASEFAIVGSKLPNAWGIYDTYGTVWEHCSDVYAKTLDYSRQPGGPEGSSDAKHVCRGGAYNTASKIPDRCSSVYRLEYSGYVSIDYGFRLVLNLGTK